MDIINTLIGIPLGWLMWLCWFIIKNYGFAIIVFTLLTKVIMFPLSVWVQKNSIKMIRIQPECNRIIARNICNRDRIAEQQSALFKRKKYSPLAGIIPMLIQIPIILGLIAVVYNPLQHLLHLDSSLISAFTQKAAEILNNPELGSNAQIAVINLVQDPAYVNQFASLSIQGCDVNAAISAMQVMDFNFFGMDLSHTPNFFGFDIYWFIPILSGVSAFLLCFFQNKENVLQKEQGFLGRWGMTAFLVAFSTYFAFIVPTGIGLYWIFGNLFAIALIYILNAMYDPKKSIDYEELEKSKIELSESKKIQKSSKLTPEQKAKSKADYACFFKDDVTKDIVVYSEKSGFYKYFNDMIDGILENSDITIDYVTSDPNDKIFEQNNPRLRTYFIDDNRLIPLFMKIDAKIMVMTTPNLQTYHLKRSLVNKKVEYIYIPHDAISTQMGNAFEAFDHFDTVFCVGPAQVKEIRETEKVYNLPAKKLVECGYGLIDQLTEQYNAIEKVENNIKKILIAPSWQEDNILDSCIDEILEQLLDKEYDITVRPHPEYVKRYAAQLQQLIAKYENRLNEHFRIETDFSSNVTIFTADLVITDWSGIALEFSYATKKPSLFINTQMKVMNPHWQEIESVPIEITLRNQLGVSLDKDKLNTVATTIQTLFDQKENYKLQIEDVIKNYLYHPGNSKKIVTEYLINAINNENSNK
ncbi:membrane protein insertase YidC [Paludicola sp. MB14-C6]|uniref:membrane protein insertase YidC n=1 Tax=Paludihabitans sp. MB14-C6 TaxID=3070656 RepID=UPI0027DDA346|nr:membrane protein insertase YidC [Paludicola sp. MB14-C6]WMJ23886.1 membrane protein insertase YidC [Paludicola sp. MB14-C6]